MSFDSRYGEMHVYATGKHEAQHAGLSLRYVRKVSGYVSGASQVDYGHTVMWVNIKRNNVRNGPAHVAAGILGILPLRSK